MDTKKRIRTMDVILVFLFTCMAAFIVTMIVVFLRMGSVPDTLIVSVFAFFGLECGVMGWIKTTKTKLEEALNDREIPANADGMQHSDDPDR